MKSLFWQLYISIIAALILIGLLFLGMMLYFEQRTDVEDFHRDSRHVATTLIGQWQSEGDLSQDFLNLMSEGSFFDIKVVHQESLPSHLIQASFVRQIQQSKIYTEGDLYLGVYPLADSGQWILIKDLDIDPTSETISEWMREDFKRELDEESDINQTIFITLFCLLILIAAVLMALVFRINRHIESLLKTNEQWRKGQLSARANTNLPSPLNKLAIGFNHMASDMEQSINKQQIMMHAISHELRTPLSKLQLALDLLQRQIPSLKSEALVLDLDRYVDELELLVNEILTLAKLNHVKNLGFNTQIDINKLVLERIKELRQLQPDKFISCNGQMDIEIWADGFYLQMMIDNVIKNALKYADKEVLVTVRSENSGVCLIFEDDGPGVAAEYRDAMLLAFAREDESRNKDSGGFGLGLAIVHAIVQQYGGVIHLGESSLGGFLVKIDLPYKRVE